jgi:hypothetical protein
VPGSPSITDSTSMQTTGSNTLWDPTTRKAPGHPPYHLSDLVRVTTPCTSSEGTAQGAGLPSTKAGVTNCQKTSAFSRAGTTPVRNISARSNPTQITVMCVKLAKLDHCQCQEKEFETHLGNRRFQNCEPRFKKKIPIVRLPISDGAWGRMGFG